MSNEENKPQSPAKIAADDGSITNLTTKQLRNCGDDTSDDSPSSIAEEIGDNENDIAQDDEIDNYVECESKTEQIPSSNNATNASGHSNSHQNFNLKRPENVFGEEIDDITPPIKPKSANRLKTKPDQKQKTTVIKPKTSSPVNSNNKLKLAKSSGKQVSIVQSDAGKDKKQMDTTTSSTLNTIQGKSKSIYVSPPIASPTATATPTTGGFNTLKTDLPGRVSFSKNDVYEIDYSDIDNDTDTSRSLDLNEPFRKKNVHFEDEYFSKYDDGRPDENAMDVRKHTFNQAPMHRLSNTKEHHESDNLLTDDKEFSTLKSNSLRCKADMRLDVLPEDNENGGNGADSKDRSEKIIEEYKREIESINRQHELERRWNECKINGDINTNSTTATYSNYFNNVNSSKRTETNESDKMAKDEWHSGGSDSWSSPNHDSTSNLIGKVKVTSANNATTAAANTTASNTSDESPTRDSASTVINNYLKITNQKSSITSKPGSATIKLRTTKKIASNPSRKIKSAQTTSSTNMAAATNGGANTSVDIKPTTSSSRLTKAKSVGHLQRITDIKLSEFQIDKVESWMSTHEDTFSDTGLNSYRKYGKFGSSSNLDYKKTWRETPTKTDDEGNYSLDDQIDNTSMDGSIGGGIELVLKKLEGRRMQISFGSSIEPQNISDLKFK